MADNNKKKTTNADSRQDAADRRTLMVRDQMEKERIATDAKTARLKALRLAQEEEEAAKPKPPPAPRAKKPSRAKPKA
ncbi:MAG: hypothetical protein RL274_1959 [Pseudomonadota bacterium]|jgi:hypothetical protein